MPSSLHPPVSRDSTGFALPPCATEAAVHVTWVLTPTVRGKPGTPVLSDPYMNLAHVCAAAGDQIRFFIENRMPFWVEVNDLCLATDTGLAIEDQLALAIKDQLALANESDTKDTAPHVMVFDKQVFLWLPPQALSGLGDKDGRYALSVRIKHISPTSRPYLYRIPVHVRCAVGRKVDDVMCTLMNRLDIGSVACTPRQRLAVSVIDMCDQAVHICEGKLSKSLFASAARSGGITKAMATYMRPPETGAKISSSLITAGKWDLLHRTIMPWGWSLAQTIAVFPSIARGRRLVQEVMGHCHRDVMHKHLTTSGTPTMLLVHKASMAEAKSRDVIASEADALTRVMCGM